MASIILEKKPDLDQAVRLMREDARYELDSPTQEEILALAQVRQGVRARPAPPTVPKVFLSNECSFNCSYCGCRAGNECKTRYQLAPQVLADVAIQAARKEKRGIFLTSAILKNADYTQELIIETLRIIRRERGFGGYVHAKVMPGADAGLIRATGLLADRLSVNIEVSHSAGYARIAKNKTRDNILTPMAQISRQIEEARMDCAPSRPRFATTQTTQLMAGSIGENDRQILTLSSALYKKYHLSRVYYTPFHYMKPAQGYEALPYTATPYWRMRRLYQADRLIETYGFTPEEIAPEGAEYLPPEVDPKLSWALRNLHLFPVEVNDSDYAMLLRVPGIGATYARRIIEARRRCRLTHEMLKLLGVALKRSRHFITCSGRYEGQTLDNEQTLHDLLADPEDSWNRHAQMKF